MSVIILLLFSFFFTEIERSHSSSPPATYLNFGVTGSRNDSCDPFDTSYVYAPLSHPYYSGVAPSECAQYYNHIKPSSESNSASTSNGFEDNYCELSSERMSSPIKQLDSKFVAELEKNLNLQETNVNSSIPTLRPPPQGNKSLLKKQPNFMSHQSTVLNQKINTSSTKTTNIQADNQRPLSEYLPSCINLHNETSSLSAAFSATDLASSERESSNDQRYSNDLLEPEIILSRMQISNKETASDSSNNLYKNTMNKCEKQPMHSELMTVLTKNNNIYNHSQNEYQEKISNGDIYLNTSKVHNIAETSSNALYSDPSIMSNALHSNTLNSYERTVASNSHDTLGLSHMYHLNNNKRSVYDDRYSSNLYGNMSNIYDAVAEEIYQNNGCTTNVYDSVADDYNYCMTPTETYYAGATSPCKNSVSDLIFFIFQVFLVGK